MKRKTTTAALAMTLILFCSCTDLQKKNSIEKPENNFMLIAYDRDIGDPAADRRSYYRVFIDKVDSGRTTTGLESQKKYFEASLSANRHLIRVEKWVLDEAKGRYVKLNNIEQPKPDFIYIVISGSRTT